MKKLFRQCVALLLLALTLVATMAPMALAASSTTKCYSIKSGNTQVYSDTGLSKKHGTIFAGDEITVLSVTEKYAKVRYNLDAGGTKTGYIARSAILTATDGKTYTSKAKVTTYKRPNGASYGHVAVGDKVVKLGSKDGYVQVKYPVSSGYKYAFVTESGWAQIQGKGGNSKTTLSNALYNLDSEASKISCGFDGYSTTSGRHEGIDFDYKIGANIYSLTDGVITNVVSGKNGSSGLSTIAIYNKSTNMTVIYLHTAPLSSLEVGQTIKKGQKIATESWRGISKDTKAHTHVEVRDGKKTHAAKSVDDSTLDNPNPTAFWQSQGYSVK